MAPKEAATATGQRELDDIKEMVEEGGPQQLQTMHTRTVKTQTNVEETKRLLQEIERYGTLKVTSTPNEIDQQISESTNLLAQAKQQDDDNHTSLQELKELDQALQPLISSAKSADNFPKVEYSKQIIQAQRLGVWKFMHDTQKYATEQEDDYLKSHGVSTEKVEATLTAADDRTTDEMERVLGFHQEEWTLKELYDVASELRDEIDQAETQKEHQTLQIKLLTKERQQAREERDAVLKQVEELQTQLDELKAQPKPVEEDLKSKMETMQECLNVTVKENVDLGKRNTMLFNMMLTDFENNEEVNLGPELVHHKALNWSLSMASENETRALVHQSFSQLTTRLRLMADELRDHRVLFAITDVMLQKCKLRQRSFEDIKALMILVDDYLDAEAHDITELNAMVAARIIEIIVRAVRATDDTRRNLVWVHADQSIHLLVRLYANAHKNGDTNFTTTLPQIWMLNSGDASVDLDIKTNSIEQLKSTDEMLPEGATRPARRLFANRIESAVESYAILDTEAQSIFLYLITEGAYSEMTLSVPKRLDGRGAFKEVESFSINYGCGSFVIKNMRPVYNREIRRLRAAMQT
ncbi:hypothetical protein KCU67_g4357, partial [Aureobasidium melanogenum]